MCFRPAAAAKGATCPKCQKKIQFIGGVVQKKCPFCGASLDKPGDNQEEKKE
jgi:predicted amidophosphoribosyltransferase